MFSICRPNAVCHKVPGLICSSSSHGLIFFSTNFREISRMAGLSSLLWHRKTSKISALGSDALTLQEFLDLIPNSRNCEAMLAQDWGRWKDSSLKSDQGLRRKLPITSLQNLAERLRCFPGLFVAEVGVAHGRANSLCGVATPISPANPSHVVKEDDPSPCRFLNSSRAPGRETRGPLHSIL